MNNKADGIFYGVIIFMLFIFILGRKIGLTWEVTAEMVPRFILWLGLVGYALYTKLLPPNGYPLLLAFIVPVMQPAIKHWAILPYRSFSRDIEYAWWSEWYIQTLLFFLIAGVVFLFTRKMRPY